MTLDHTRLSPLSFVMNLGNRDWEELVRYYGYRLGNTAGISAPSTLCTLSCPGSWTRRPCSLFVSLRCGGGALWRGKRCS